MTSRRLGLASLVLFVLFGILTLAVMGSPTDAGGLASLGTSLFDFTRTHALVADGARALSFIGNDAIAGLVVVVAALVLFFRRHRALAVFVVLSAGIGVVLATIVKELVDRGRPASDGVLAMATSPSYPSGHACAGITVYASIGIAVLLIVHAGWGKAAGIILIVVGVLIGVSRILLGVHWVSDVMGGWLLGSAIVCGVGAGVLAWVLRRSATAG